MWKIKVPFSYSEWCYIFSSTVLYNGSVGMKLFSRRWLRMFVSCGNREIINYLPCLMNGYYLILGTIHPTPCTVTKEKFSFLSC